MNQTVPAAERSLIELASKWEALLGEPAPQEIADARDRLKRNVEFIRRATELESPDVLMQTLVQCDTIASQCAQQSAQLLVALDDYGPGRGDYRDHGSALILKCIRAFACEVAERLELPNSPRLFPFFDDG